MNRRSFLWGIPAILLTAWATIRGQRQQSVASAPSVPRKLWGGVAGESLSVGDMVYRADDNCYYRTNHWVRCGGVKEFQIIRRNAKRGDSLMMEALWSEGR